MKPQLTVRVYGLIMHENHVLVSDETYAGINMTKFPGGGLEFGEGPIDTLKRELMEELNIEIESAKHFYTTDFFQASAFHQSTQIISIYYSVEIKNPDLIKASKNSSAIFSGDNNQHFFRWISIENVNENLMSYPIDKHVAKLISDYYNNLDKPV